MKLERVALVVFALIFLGCAINYFVFSTGLPPGGVMLIREMLNSMSDVVAVIVIMVPIFILLTPILLFITRSGD